MFDSIAVPNTIILRWGTRPKFISFGLLVFSFACVKSLALLPIVLLITSVMFFLSGVPALFLLKRLRIPASFILFMAIILVFFTQGQVIGTLGPFTVTREGVESALLMLGRFACILTLLIILFATTTLVDILAVMESLGIPEFLVDMLMFTHRYLHELSIMFRQMNIAMVMRGFTGQKLKAIYSYSYLAGTILIRSYEQAERIYQAMVIRGYGQQNITKPYREASPEDRMLCTVCVGLAVALSMVQFYLLYPGGII